MLRSLRLEGSSVYTDDAVAKLASGYLGREVTLAEVYELANALTARYRSDGYILSQVVVPPQTVRDGAIRLLAVEGHIDQVTVQGDFPGRRADLQAYAQKIRRSRPLRIQVLERYLLLINDLGGVSARATLSPSRKLAGAADLLLEVTGRKLGGTAQLNNRGGRLYGPWQGHLGAVRYSLFGGFEQTAARFISSVGNDELRYVSLSHDQPLGSEGLRLGLSVARADGEPGVQDRLGGLRFDTRSEAAEIGLSYPVVRARARNLYLRARFSYYDRDTEESGLLFSRDRIRALRAGLSYDFADRWRGVNVIDVELSRGLDILGATGPGSPDLSRASGRSDFTKINVYAARLQSLAPGWSLLAAFGGQYATTDLLTPEQFAIGGEPFGRGYDPSEIVGDSGAAARLELRYAGGPAARLIVDHTLYAFYDVGKVWRRTVLAGQSDSDSVASAGLGVRLNLAARLSGYAELVKPLTRTVFAEGDRDPRLFVGLAAAF